ncbi:MAG: RNA methyltransferase [Tenericutes bacterium HGW-Tenericutes-5]|nr:MAG: RNA methyltransferase [Tenericutes bacterium HGW-Tenericutes-5]
MTNAISSIQNNLIKDITKLKLKKYRQESNLFLIEGYHLVEEAYNAGLLKQIFYVDECPYKDIESYQVTDNVLKKLSVLPSPQGILGVCKRPIKKALSDKVLILDNVQDPGNIGTLMRSASSFGFETIIAENSVDFFNDKVIRSSQGAVFKLNLINTEIIEFLQNNQDYSLYVTDLKANVFLEDIDLTSKRIGVILGNEGTGVNQEILNLIDNKIKIKMQNMESLNVGVAGSIIMYEISKGVK